MDTSLVENKSQDSRFNCAICLDSVDASPVVTLCGHLFCWRCLYEWLAPGMISPSEYEYLNLPPATTHSNMSRRVCPVCKADCSVKNVIPIYVREFLSSEKDTTNSEGSNDSDENEKRFSPARPLPPVSYTSRSSVTSTANSLHTNTTIQSSSSNPSLFQALLRLQTTIQNLHSTANTPLVDPNIQINGDTPTDSNHRPTGEPQSTILQHTQLAFSSAHASSGRLINHDDSNYTQPVESPVAISIDASTEFLSRLLLLLGSFVLLCLLLF